MDRAVKNKEKRKENMTSVEKRRELGSMKKMTGESFYSFSDRVKSIAEDAFPNTSDEFIEIVSADAMIKGCQDQQIKHILEDYDIRTIEDALQIFYMNLANGKSSDDSNNKQEEQTGVSKEDKEEDGSGLEVKVGEEKNYGNGEAEYGYRENEDDGEDVDNGEYEDDEEEDEYETEDGEDEEGENSEGEDGEDENEKEDDENENEEEGGEDEEEKDGENGEGEEDGENGEGEENCEEEQGENCEGNEEEEDDDGNNTENDNSDNGDYDDEIVCNRNMVQAEHERIRSEWKDIPEKTIKTVDNNCVRIPEQKTPIQQKNNVQARTSSVWLKTIQNLNSLVKNMVKENIRLEKDITKKDMISEKNPEFKQSVSSTRPNDSIVTRQYITDYCNLIDHLAPTAIYHSEKLNTRKYMYWVEYNRTNRDLEFKESSNNSIGTQTREQVTHYLRDEQQSHQVDKCVQTDDSCFQQQTETTDSQIITSKKSDEEKKSTVKVNEIKEETSNRKKETENNVKVEEKVRINMKPKKDHKKMKIDKIGKCLKSVLRKKSNSQDYGYYGSDMKKPRIIEKPPIRTFKSVPR